MLYAFQRFFVRKVSLFKTCHNLFSIQTTQFITNHATIDAPLAIDKYKRKPRQPRQVEPTGSPTITHSNEKSEDFIVDLSKTRTDIQGLSFLEFYRKLKSQYPEHYLLALQNGDFFEFFDEDAKRAASIAGIVLTSKSKTDDRTKEKISIPFSGFPLRTLDTFLPKFVKAGVYVVLAEQISQPGTKQGSIERAVTRIITPGTIVEENLLEGGNNFLLAIYTPIVLKALAMELIDGSVLQPAHKETLGTLKVGLAWTDISTGFLTTEECSLLDLHSRILKISPKEIVCTSRNTWLNDYIQRIASSQGVPISFKETSHFSPKSLKRKSAEVLDVSQSLKETEANALGGLYSVLSETLVGKIPALRHTSNDSHLCMQLDSDTFKSLEILTHLTGTAKHSLLHHLDGCQTSIGSRLLARRLCQPSLDLDEIDRRLGSIDIFMRDKVFLEDVREVFRGVADCERAVQRLEMNRGNGTGPKDMHTIRRALKAQQVLKTRIQTQCALTTDKNSKKLMQDCLKRLGDFDSLAQHLDEALCDQTLLRLEDGASLFNPAYLEAKFSKDLKEKQAFLAGLETTIAKLERTYQLESKKYALKIIRVANDIYLEANVKEDALKNNPKFILLNTTKFKARYQSSDLIQLKENIISCEVALQEAESNLFEDLRCTILKHQDSLIQMIQALAELDLSVALAKLAQEKNYCRPIMSKDSSVLEIVAGRHVVVESLKLSQQKNYVPNDCFMDKDTARFHFITGPNMGGKSTFLRQVALIVLMAHCGMFVPAQSAIVGLTDAIFTRIGAADNLVEGQSTFMMEMQQTASILQKASPRSLVIMDEIGRGTSYQEGLAIAFGVSSHLYQSLQCKTLFATHYHYLGHHLLARFKALKPFQTTAKIFPSKEIVFLQKLLPGIASHSYALQVAEYAGLPPSVIQDALDFAKEHQ